MSTAIEFNNISKLFGQMTMGSVLLLFNNYKIIKL